MARPRLLHLLEATTAGVRRYVTCLARSQRAEWDVTVACPAIRETHFGDVAFVDDMQSLGITVHRLSLRRAIGRQDLSATRELLALARRQRFDLIHTHSSKAGFIGRWVAKVAGVPVLHTPNGLYFLEQTGVKRWFYLTLERLTGYATSRLIAVSPGERQVMLQYRLAAPERIHLLENGVDVSGLRRQAQTTDADEVRRRFGLAGPGPLIGGVGRMAPQKDPLSFVRAAQCLTRTFPAARFIWCGDGELRLTAERLAQTLNVSLHVTGHLENVWPVMRLFDVFVLPSRYEGLPFTLLEAMALDVPVVTTDVVGARDVVDGVTTGWRVAPGDADALAAAIGQVLAQPEEARRRCAQARQLVEARFSLDRMIAAHRALYAGVLAAAPQRVGVP